TMLGTAAETVAPNATSWWTRVAAASPPAPAALVRAAEATGTRAVLARASIATLENISLRGLGRGLHFLSYEGIVSYGIAGYVFQHAPRHSNHPLIFDREYDLNLPERERSAAAPAATSPADHPNPPNRPRRQGRHPRPHPAAATGSLLPTAR
ncbi:MAG: hypothetical protein K8R69_12450, partial [Deltaproteobacteria bacterium]|nr:hypothetical protein [Deltaproteobacteria bacterium]